LGGLGGLGGLGSLEEVGVEYFQPLQEVCEVLGAGFLTGVSKRITVSNRKILKLIFYVDTPQAVTISPTS